MDCVTGLKEPLNLEGNWQRPKTDLQVGPETEEGGCAELRAWGLDEGEGDGECDHEVMLATMCEALGMGQALSEARFID